MYPEIESSVRKNVPWTGLPQHLKQQMNFNARNYDKYIVTFSIKNQLRYKGNLVRSVLRDEKRYYERIISYSRERLMLFPYHLADMIVKGLRCTPFNYYVSVVERLMQAEKSYDTLPNFTAADCLRLLGIGRNEYIELMNRSRSNRARLFGKRNVRGMLPSVPCNIHIEPWWRIEVGLVLEDDVQMVNEEELAVIDRLIDYGSQTAGELNYFVVLSLYKKGLIYIDIPITAEDRIQVPPLQGFVMNRVLGDDYFETLLYKIFVSIDEHTTVGELATVLEIETEHVKQAVSLYCRLKFARKLESPDDEMASIAQRKMHPSWSYRPSPPTHPIDITPLTLNLSTSTTDFVEIQSPTTPDSPKQAMAKKGQQRVAFFFDSTLTAFLMMGNLSPGLKKHAVTMFEVGKLCDESIETFLAELEKVSVLDAEGEGEARRFFEHAVLLRSTILALKKLESAGLDLVRIESLHSLDAATTQRLLRKKYRLLVSMAPLSREARSVCSLQPPHLGPAAPEVNTLWFKLYIYHVTGCGPPSLLLKRGVTLKRLPRMFLGFTRLLVTQWLHEPAVIPVANFMHVNAALQYSPVLIQAYGVHQVAETHIVPFPFSKDWSSTDKVTHSHSAVKRLRTAIDLEHNCGYLTFANIGVEAFESSDELQSPNESHFAVTPPEQSSSPANGFTSIDCTEILKEELDSLQEQSLLSPADEAFSMFSMIDASEVVQSTSTAGPTTPARSGGQVWTLLDCQFGVPLFDVDANTKICDHILKGGLTSNESLEKLVESSRDLGDKLLKFISQCQYHTDEHMSISKRGKLTPLPKYNMVFDNGKISEWSDH